MNYVASLGNKAAEMTGPAKKSITLPLLLAAVVLLGIFAANAHEYLHYFPYGDDPAVFLASSGSPAGWFTSGFSHYFLVYPEWSVPYTDFLRPGVNGIVRLYQILFAHHYVLYFATFYGAQFLLVWLVLLIARDMHVSQRVLFLLELLLAINPAFFNFGITSVVNQFDFWCGFFAVAALFCLRRDRFALTVLFLTLAIFTKEAALYAPIAAALTVTFTTRRRLLATTMLLPLLAWAGVRKFLFAGSAQGLYAVPINSPRAILLGIIKGVLQWPTGLVPDLAVKSILSHHDLLHNIVPLILLATNILFWVLLVGLGMQLFRKDTAEPLAFFTVFLWLCRALSFGIIVGPDPRFGGSIYPLELLLLATASVALPLSRWRSLSSAAMCLMVPMFLWHMHAAPLEIDASGRPLMKEQNAALKRNGTTADDVYILNSAPAFSAPAYLASLAGITARIVVLNQFDGCLSSHQAITSFKRRGDSVMDVTVQLPPCAHFLFNSVPPNVLAQAIDGKEFLRWDLAVYSLPSARITGHSVRNAQMPEVDPGSRLNISLKLPIDRSILLYYDWTIGSYRCIGKRCADPS